MRDADQADAWIAAKEAFLQAEESSDSLDTVETLLKNQLNFEKSLTAYEEKIKVLQQSSDQLIQQEHVDSDVISERCKEVLENWERLKKLATAKVGDLGESRKLFQFLRDAEEVSNKLFDERGYLHRTHAETRVACSRVFIMWGRRKEMRAGKISSWWGS